MNTIKERLRNNLIIGFILGIVSYHILLYVLIHVYNVSVTKTPEKESKDWTSVRGNVDIQYLLEASKDSIWIENYTTGKVCGGTYTQLDSLINQ